MGNNSIVYIRLAMMAGGVIFNDLKMDSSYDEDEENLDNILITIKFK